ncbi:hypothetical protein CTAYLR_007558 [Chrysophaeum taylorii]|uniref:Glycoside hydrolase family 5 domain-containing protein n=1 Tax=Chrysophaeum taylorii TaxID=2483200 RepID=A0AAD7U4W6_9STRA|nr:hypothetical protein CTAYLR_007558 [Chrysophaeum taylorii]
MAAAAAAAENKQYLSVTSTVATTLSEVTTVAEDIAMSVAPETPIHLGLKRPVTTNVPPTRKPQGRRARQQRGERSSGCFYFCCGGRSARNDPSIDVVVADYASKVAAKQPKHYYVHEDPKGCCVCRYGCPKEGKFPRGARISMCLGVLFLAGISTALLFPWRDPKEGNKRDKYNNKADPFNPDLSPTYAPTKRPTLSPTPAPQANRPSMAPTATPQPTIQGINLPGSVVNKHGWLSVDATSFGIPQIVDEHGEIIQLKGMSMFWSNTGWGAEKFWTREAVKILVEDWNIEVIRASLGAEDDGGYVDEPSENFDRLIAVVDAALEFGIYCVIDWHSHYADEYQDRAESFFTFVAGIYGRYPNIVYEPWNEPVDQSWTTTIKPYHETIISIVRREAPYNIILLGSRQYSQRVDEAADDPVTGYDNIAYTFHFYAATHADNYRDYVLTALSRGVAVMCTEFGTVRADGDGDVDLPETRIWMEFMNSRNISWMNWAVSDRDEGSAILKDGSYTPNFDIPWPDSDLTDSGTIIKAYLNDEDV